MQHCATYGNLQVWRKWEEHFWGTYKTTLQTQDDKQLHAARALMGPAISTIIGAFTHKLDSVSSTCSDVKDQFIVVSEKVA